MAVNLADAETGDGPLHTNFTLNSAGGYVGLYTAGGGLVDNLNYGALSANISYGRYFDGSDLLRQFITPTPAGENHIVLSPVILNEYSAVADNQYIKDGGSDTFWVVSLATAATGLSSSSPRTTWIYAAGGWLLVMTQEVQVKPFRHSP